MPSTVRDFLPNQILATVLCNVASNTMCIRFPLPVICSFVGVIVVKNPPAINFDQSSYNTAQAFNPISPNAPYITAAWDRRAVANNEVPLIINVGDNTVTVAENMQYPNTVLDSNTDYAVFVRFSIEADNMPEPLYVYSETVMTRTGQLTQTQSCSFLSHLFFDYSSSI